MVINPSSLFLDPKQGQTALDKGEIGSDVYPVCIKDLGQKDSISFLLKEIEYETSTVAEFAYATAIIADGAEVATDDSHSKTYLVSGNRYVSEVEAQKKSIDSKSVFTTNTQNLDATSEQPINESLYLDHGEEVVFSVKKNKNGDTHLAVAAFFHHLHTGGAEKFISDLAVVQPKAVQSIYQKSFLRRNLPFVGSLSVLLAVFLPVSVALNDQNLIKFSNSIPKAHADTPHKSLYYYYKNSNGKWVHFSIMHPRFKLSQRVTVQVPEEAFIDGRNEVEIKVISNSRHYIYSIGLVDQVESVEMSDFTPISGKVNGAIKHSFENKSQFVTLPGDAFAFTVSNIKPEATHIFFKIQGHYSPLLCSNESEAKNWWNKLSSQEQTMMKTPSAYGV